MKKPTPVTAVFDIGKTNKKFFLFDGNYSIVQKQQTTFDQTEDDDGDSCEDLRLLEYWVENKIQDALEDKKVQIEALNFSTHGASFVHLSNKGNVVTPLYDYLKPHPEDLFEEFYRSYGGKKELSLQTASPPMGMLNSGFQLYWLKHEKPLQFKEIACSMHFPQYLSYLITGKKTAELTSIGCHTSLWDYEQEKYHEWLKKEDLDKLLPNVRPVSTTFETNYHGSQFKTGIGIHDSSAALAPYILALDEPFMLISTGTWSITFNPFNKAPLTFQELQKDCLCYLDIHGNQVKASRFFLGNEYMHQKKKLNRHFHGEGWQNTVELDADLLSKLIQKNKPAQKLKLEQAYNSGPFPAGKHGEWRIDRFSSYKEAYHQLMLDLVSIQTESIKLTEGTEKVDKLIITGGFSQNDFFVTLLASFFPEKKIFTSSLPNASALGAAMVVNNGIEQQEDKNALKQLLSLKQHYPEKGLDVEQYSWKNSVAS